MKITPLSRSFPLRKKKKKTFFPFPGLSDSQVRKKFGGFHPKNWNTPLPRQGTVSLLWEGNLEVMIKNYTDGPFELSVEKPITTIGFSQYDKGL